MPRHLEALRADLNEFEDRYLLTGYADSFYLLNDCEDDTEQTLIDAELFAGEVYETEQTLIDAGLLAGESYEIFDTGFEGWERTGKTRRSEANMARVFNEWMIRSLYRGYDYLYLVSSDIAVSPGVLNSLLDVAKSTNWPCVVGAACYNGRGGSMNWMIRRDGSYCRPDGDTVGMAVNRKYPLDVNLVGSPMIIPRSIVEERIPHTAHPQSHLCGWFDGVAKAGHRVLLDPSQRVDHWLDRDTCLTWPGAGK